jgi:hypothetical protein
VDALDVLLGYDDDMTIGDGSVSREGDGVFVVDPDAGGR